MRQMILTGLSSEQKFNNGNGGATEYALVFNNGELRIPITEEAARAVVQAMYGEAPAEEEPEGNGEGHLPAHLRSTGSGPWEGPPQEESDFAEEDGVPSV